MVNIIIFIFFSILGYITTCENFPVLITVVILLAISRFGYFSRFAVSVIGILLMTLIHYYLNHPEFVEKVVFYIDQLKTPAAG